MKCFVISLTRSVERRELIEKRLNSLHVEWCFFDAVDGKNRLPDKFLNKQTDIYRKIFRSRALSSGEKGCYASQYSLWETCVELNENIIILEDDVLIEDIFVDVIAKLPKLHEKYDYIKLELPPSMVQKVIYEGGDLIFTRFKNGASMGGYSLTPKAAKQYIKYSQKWTCAVDNFIGEYYKHKVKSYALFPFAISQRESFTSVDIFESTIQLKGQSNVIVPFKLLRECHRFYRFVRLSIWNFLDVIKG